MAPTPIEPIPIPPPKELQAILEAALENLDAFATLRFRPMFGGITGYVYEQSFASLSDIGLAFKLAPADQEELLNLGGERLQYEPTMPPSKTSIVVPAAMLTNHADLAKWATRSASFVQTLPAKKKQAPKS